MDNEGDAIGPPDSAAATLDARGLRCPLPVLKARHAIKALGRGEVLLVIADDPVAPIDIANWCREDGHALLTTVASDAAVTFYLRKG